MTRWGSGVLVRKWQYRDNNAELVANLQIFKIIQNAIDFFLSGYHCILKTELHTLHNELRKSDCAISELRRLRNELRRLISELRRMLSELRSTYSYEMCYLR